MLTFKEVETVIAILTGTHESRRPVLRARLRHFHQKGIPIGFHAEGRGPQANYNCDMLFQMILVVIMTQGGLNPDTVAIFMKGYWSNGIYRRFISIYAQSTSKEFDIYTPLEHQYIIFELNQLFHLQSEEGGGYLDPFEKIYIRPFHEARALVMSPGPFRPDKRSKDASLIHNFQVVNLSAMLASLRSRLVEAGHEKIVGWLGEQASVHRGHTDIR